MVDLQPHPPEAEDFIAAVIGEYLNSLDTLEPLAWHLARGLPYRIACLVREANRAR